MIKNLAIFASGAGSNFNAIANAIDSGRLNARIAILVSDCPKSGAVAIARSRGINVFAFNPKEYPHKEAYERIICNILRENAIDLIILAGYMRIIGLTLLQSYSQRIINIHPSLLPKYKGIDAIGQALNAREKYTGVTIHYVDEGIDTGTIIAQKRLRIRKGENRGELEKRIHKIEHQLYPQTIKKLLEEGK